MTKQELIDLLAGLKEQEKIQERTGIFDDRLLSRIASVEKLLRGMNNEKKKT